MKKTKHVAETCEGESITARAEGKNRVQMYYRWKRSQSVSACFLWWMQLPVCDIFDPVWQVWLLCCVCFPNYLAVNA